jgi:phosphate-selective porin OprO and OprP
MQSYFGLRLDRALAGRHGLPRIARPLKILLSCILFAGWSASSLAQTESDERAMIDVSHGLAVSKDSMFLLNIRFRMQNRVGLKTNSLEDWSVEEIEARVRRLRLRFDGFVGSPKLEYYIQLAFSRADQDFDNGGQAKIIRDAILYYRFDPHFYIGFGQSKLPGNRQRVNSSGNLQFADRSIANASYTLDRDFGAFAYYTGNLGNMVFNAKMAISTGEGRNITQTDNGLAYTLRGEWLPFGLFANNGDYSEGDLEFEPTPKLSLALTLSQNEGTRQSGGQLGTALLEGVDLRTWISDASFKYKGHACLMEWMHRQSSVLLALDMEGEPVAIPAGTGLNFQYSYTTRSFWEASFRFSSVQPDDDSLLRNQRELLFGMNKYINKHRIKVQAHIGYQSAFNDTMARRWAVGMFQVEFGI